VFEKLVLRNKFLILDTYYPDTVYLRSKDVRILRYCWKTKGVSEQNRLGKHCS